MKGASKILGSQIGFCFDILYYGRTTAMQSKQKYKGTCRDTSSNITKFKMSKGIMLYGSKLLIYSKLDQIV